MKCEVAHLTIAGLTGNDIPSELARHIESCPECAQLLTTDSRFRGVLRTEAVAPLFALDRIRQAVAETEASPRDSWIELLRRSKTMKLTLPVFALAAMAALFVALPRASAATTALTKFSNMKHAVLASAKHGAKTDDTKFGIKVGKKDDGTIGTWVVVNGELTEVASGSTYTSTDHGKTFKVTTKVHGDASSLSPEEQKMVADIIAGHQDGNVTVKTIVNGKEVSPEKLQEIMKSYGVDFSIDIDLDADHYSQIAFGKDENTLMLTKKGQKGKRLIVQLDPTSSMPKTVQLQKLVKGKWSQVRQSSITLL